MIYLPPLSSASLRILLLFISHSPPNKHATNKTFVCVGNKRHMFQSRPVDLFHSLSADIVSSSVLSLPPCLHVMLQQRGDLFFFSFCINYLYCFFFNATSRVWWFEDRDALTGSGAWFQSQLNSRIKDFLFFLSAYFIHKFSGQCLLRNIFLLEHIYVFKEAFVRFSSFCSPLSSKYLWECLDLCFAPPAAGNSGPWAKWMAATDKLDREKGSVAVRLHTPW